MSTTSRPAFLALCTGLCMLGLMTNTPVSAQTIYLSLGTPLNVDWTTATSVQQSTAFSYHTDNGEIIPGDYQCLWFKICVDREGLGLSVNDDYIPARIQDAVIFPAEHYGQFTCSSDEPFPELFTDWEWCPPSTEMDLTEGEYYVVWFARRQPGRVLSVKFDFSQPSGCSEPETPCPDCLSSFSPLPEKTYRISAWVTREDLPIGSMAVFADGDPYLKVECPVGSTTDLVEDLKAVGPVIDGWQLIEGRFTMPEADPDESLEMRISMGSSDAVNAVYFDDVRVFPEDASMKSYVYDPQNLRFVAELDERHFATFYEYDSEGRLVRVKKETERGVMTIKETRQNAAREQTP